MRRGRAAGVLVVGFAALTLQSCTIAYFDLKNELESPRSSELACDVRYSISLASTIYTNTFGTSETDKRRFQKELDKFVADTGDVLRRKGCSAAYVEHDDEATLEIRVEHRAQISLQPQELLTGLTGGAIPSWSTRKAVYVYAFTDKASGKAHRYTVDYKAYHHLVLFPVFWLNFFTDDSRKVYKDALTNFLSHSEPSAPTDIPYGAVDKELSLRVATARELTAEE